MKICFGGLVAEVKPELVSVASLGHEPVVVELVNGWQSTCAECLKAKGLVECPEFPYCSSVRVKEFTVPLYAVGVVQTAEGEETQWREGEPCVSYRRRRYALKDGKLTEVRSQEMCGYELVERDGKVVAEPRKAHEESTGTIDVGDGDLYPAGVASSFLPEKTYELVAKTSKKQSETDRNLRNEYAIAKKLVEQGKVICKTDFVWKAGTYKSWGIVIEPMMFADGKFLLVMKTTGATLEFKNAMTPPTETEAKPEVVAPTLNNLQALTSFLEKARAKVAVPQVQTGA
jgi:hypothetical protein